MTCIPRVANLSATQRFLMSLKVHFTVYGRTMRFNDRTFGHAERIIREPVANSSPELLRRGLMKKSSFGCQQHIIIVAWGGPPSCTRRSSPSWSGSTQTQSDRRFAVKYQPRVLCVCFRLWVRLVTWVGVKIRVHFWVP